MRVVVLKVVRNVEFRFLEGMVFMEVRSFLKRGVGILSLV